MLVKLAENLSNTMQNFCDKWDMSAIGWNKGEAIRAVRKRRVGKAMPQANRSRSEMMRFIEVGSQSPTFHWSKLTRLRGNSMKQLTRITIDPEVMGGKPCIRGLRVTVGTLVGLIHLQNTVGSLSTGLELVIPVQQIGNYQPFN